MEEAGRGASDAAAPKATPGPYSTVAVVDTGLSAERLDDAVVLRGINLSGDGGEEDTADNNGHGTGVASTILRFTPRAPLLPVKLMVDCGYLRWPDRLEAAFEWILERCTRLRIGVICATFADGSRAIDDLPHRGSRLQVLIAALREAGVATVAPAGNQYAQRRVSGDQGMAWPAILREVISAGALAPLNGVPHLSPLTKRLHEQVGTGCHTTAFVEPGAPGDTSGAAAVVAGCLAALRGAHPDTTVDELVVELMHFRRDIMDGLSWPALDVRALLSHLSGSKPSHHP